MFVNSLIYHSTKYNLLQCTGQHASIKGRIPLNNGKAMKINWHVKIVWALYSGNLDLDDCYH